MHHVVLLKKRWRHMEQLLIGTKTAEARWTTRMKDPWDQVKYGDWLFFRENKGPILAKARVLHIKQYKLKWDKQAQDLLTENQAFLLGTSPRTLDLLNTVLGKKYCLIVYFMGVKSVRPFNIDTSAYPKNSNWITIKNVKNIRTEFVPKPKKYADLL